MNLGKSKRYRYSAFHCTSILTSSAVKDHSWVMEVGSGGLSASSRHQPSFLGLRRVLGGQGLCRPALAHNCDEAVAGARVPRGKYKVGHRFEFKCQFFHYVCELLTLSKPQFYLL